MKYVCVLIINHTYLYTICILQILYAYRYRLFVEYVTAYTVYAIRCVQHSILKIVFICSLATLRDITPRCERCTFLSATPDTFIQRFDEYSQPGQYSC